MKAVTTYSDYRNQPAELTDEEIRWFDETVERALKATGYNVQIIPYDHDLYEGSHREALGVCCTSDPENQLGEGVETYITVDCYFIDECWRHEFKGDYLFTQDTLVSVIAHELAHLTVWRHGRKHQKLTESILKKIA